jgi:biopolymer transport protein ExbD
MARVKKNELKKTKVEIIPMIDTMFFLLVFFILSSLGIVKLQGINIDLPEVASQANPTKGKTAELMVTIDKAENIMVDGKPVIGRPKNIGPILQREVLRELGPQPDMLKASVIINADPEVRHGLVVQCIDQARQVNIKNFAIATKEDSAATDTTTTGTAPATGKAR